MPFPQRLQRGPRAAAPTTLEVEALARPTGQRILQLPYPSPPPDCPLPPLPSTRSREQPPLLLKKPSHSGFKPVLVPTAEEYRPAERLKTIKSKERLGRMPPPVPNVDEPWLINPGRYRSAEELPSCHTDYCLANDVSPHGQSQYLRQNYRDERSRQWCGRFLEDDVFAPDTISSYGGTSRDATGLQTRHSVEMENPYLKSHRVLRQPSEETMRPSGFAIPSSPSVTAQLSPTVSSPSQDVPFSKEQQTGGNMPHGDSLRSFSTGTGCSSPEPHSPQGSVTKRYVVERRHLLGMEKPRPGQIIAGRADAVEMDAGQMAADAMRSTSWERAPPSFPLVPVTTLSYFGVEEESHRSGGNSKPGKICLETVKQHSERIKSFGRNMLRRRK